MRNPGDMIILDRIAREVFRTPGIAMVQSITRPLGGPVDHTSIPFQLSAQSIPVRANLQFMKDRADDMLTMSRALGTVITSVQRMQGLIDHLSHTTHRARTDIVTMKATLDDMRDHLADFDDVARPIRGYLYAEQHCFDIPVCWAARSLFDSIDGVDTFSDNITAIVGDVDDVDTVIPQLRQQLSPIISAMSTMQASLVVTHSSFANLIDQVSRMTDTATAN